jgi:hypothetical protein
MAYIGQDPVIGRYIIVDQISGGFNGTASGFTLAAGGQGVIPGLAQNVLLSLGGVIQQPGTDYTVSGSGITFTTPPLSGTTFFATVLGDVQAVGTPSDGTVLPASIATSGTFVFPNITTTGTTLIASGNASTPSLAVIGDTNTGLYSPGADQLSITTGGTERFRIDSAGQLEAVSLGTAAAPTFSFTTDPNTGIYSPGADQVAVATNGVGRLFVDATGSTRVESVNIPLTVSRSVSGAGLNGLVLRQSDTTDGNGLAISYESDTTGAGGTPNQPFSAIRFSADVHNQATRAGSIRFLTSQGGVGDTLERLRITSAGLVGIGTSAPISLLHIQGTSGTYPTATLNHSVLGLEGEILRIGRTDATTRYHSITAQQSATAGGANNYLAFKIHNVVNTTAQTEVLRLTGNGRVGIGTTSPSYLLDLQGSGAVSARVLSSGSDALLRLTNTTASTGREFYISSTNSGNLIFVDNTSGGQRMALDSSGRLLVGTSTVLGTSTLVVQGIPSVTNPGIYLSRASNASTIVDGNTLGFIEYGSQDNGLGAQIVAVADGTWSSTSDCPTRLVFSTTSDGASSPTERARIDSSGRLGIGTTTARAGLTIARGSNGIPAAGTTDGCAVFGNAQDLAVYGLVIGANTSGVGYIQAQRTDGTATTYDLALQPNGGRVGIGVSSPGYPLSVSGNNGTDVAIVNGIGGAAYYGVAGNKPINFETNGSTKMSISAGGSVGIGTTSPASLLHVASGDARISDSGATQRLLRISNSAGATEYRIQADGNSYLYNDGYLAISSGGGSERVRIDSSGRLLVGTSSSTSSKKLIVVGSSVNESSLWLGNNGGAPGSGNAFNALYFGGGGTSGQDRAVRIEAFQDGGFADFIGLRFFTLPGDGTGPTERMRISNGGEIYLNLTSTTGVATGSSVNQGAYFSTGT